MKFKPLALFGLVLSACSAPMPKNLGINNNKLSDCPDKPNCVSTYSSTEQHKIKNLELKEDAAKSIEAIKRVAKYMKGFKLVNESENYLHFEVTSALMKFIDDVEFYIDQESNTVHFRSASRIGHSDMGANRKRMNEFRLRYMQL